MKLFNKFSIALATIALGVSSCQDFNELSNNPNRPQQTPPSMVLTGILEDMYERPWSLEHRQNQFFACNYNYYGTNEYWNSASFNYMTLKNVITMEEEAERFGEATANSYKALGKFLRAYFYMRMTQRVGDVPLAEALKGSEEVTPSYDSQKDVFKQILTWLEEANNELASAQTLNGDFYYNGDPQMYRKAVNAFRLRVLISLSKKSGEADLNIAQQVQQILDNPAKYPLMESNDDNLQYTYNGTTVLYPTNPGNRGFDKGRYNMAETYVKLLTDLNDPRVYVTCNPAKKKVADGVSPTSFAAYVGAPSGESLDNMTVKAGNGEYSYANQKRYYGSFQGMETGVQLSYAEQCFNIAEAINRGWATGDAEAYYNAGIIASMSFYGIRDGAKINITDADNDETLASVTIALTSYMEQASVKYAGNNENGLTQILQQKYLAFFQNSGQEAYFNFRRTGVPDFNEGPGTGNQGSIPKRWKYPVSETTNNSDNYKAALTRQFGSDVDDVNAELWINK